MIIAGCSNMSDIKAYSIPKYEVPPKLFEHDVFIGVYYKNESKEFDDYMPFLEAPKTPFEHQSTHSALRALISTLPPTVNLSSKIEPKTTVFNIKINGLNKLGAMTIQPPSLWASIRDTFLRIITLNLAYADYVITANFDVTYELKVSDQEPFEKTYTVNESVLISRSPLSGIDTDIDRARSLFEEQILLNNAKFWDDKKTNPTKPSNLALY